MMKVCDICGKEFDEGQVEPIKITYNDKVKVFAGIKAVNYHGHFYSLCNNCLMPFVLGICTDYYESYGVEVEPDDNS